MIYEDKNTNGAKHKKFMLYIKIAFSVIVTAVSCYIIYILNIPNPNVILFTVVVFFTFSGDFTEGIPSALVVFLYSLIFFSDSKDQLFHYSGINAEKVIVIAIAITIMVVMVGTLARRVDKKNTELLAANSKLEKLSRIDPLTGLPNRRAFDEVYNREFSNAVHLQQSFAIMILDIDFFKQYNDTYGHIAGDNCLQNISSVFYKVISFAMDFAARFGGEEFIVLLHDTDEEGAEKVAENIQRQINDLNIPHTTSTVASHVTVSVGIAIDHPDSQTDPAAFLNRADKALYQAKNSGRNRIVVYHED